MKIAWREIDRNSWEREAAFSTFNEFDYPYLVVGADLELGTALEHFKKNGISPYLAIVHAVCRSANSIPAFRQRIRGSRVIEHEILHADFVVPKGEDSFAIRLVPFSEAFNDFLAAATSEEGLQAVETGPVAEENDHWVFMSSTPWIKFTHVVQPITRSSSSIPRIVWGKFYQQDGKWKVPFSVQVHHGLVDGIHIARFFERIESYFASPETHYRAR